MFGVICYQVLNRREHDADVQRSSADVCADAFRLAAGQHSTHCYLWECRVYVPSARTIRMSRAVDRRDLTAFFGGAFICGGNGGTEENVTDRSLRERTLPVRLRLTCIVLVVQRIGVSQRTEHDYRDRVDSMVREMNME